RRRGHTILVSDWSSDVCSSDLAVAVRIGDTRYPQGPASGGSKTTGSITPAARNAAHAAKLRLLEQVAPALEAKPEELAMAGGREIGRAACRGGGEGWRGGVRGE